MTSTRNKELISLYAYDENCLVETDVPSIASILQHSQNDDKNMSENNGKDFCKTYIQESTYLVLFRRKWREMNESRVP